MAPLKAPGPDGFQVMFYKKLWNIVSNSMHKLVEDFFKDGVLLEGLNETNIFLIPKV